MFAAFNFAWPSVLVDALSVFSYLTFSSDLLAPEWCVGAGRRSRTLPARARFLLRGPLGSRVSSPQSPLPPAPCHPPPCPRCIPAPSLLRSNLSVDYPSRWYVMASLPLLLALTIVVVLAGTRALQYVQRVVCKRVPFGVAAALNLVDVCVGIFFSGLYYLYFRTWLVSRSCVLPPFPPYRLTPFLFHSPPWPVDMPPPPSQPLRFRP
jgi:hypothetical protein